MGEAILVARLPRARRSLWSIVAVGLGLFLSASPLHAGMGTFADCIRRSGAVLYGAPWCGVCRNQLAMFEGYENRLRYVECSTQGNPKKILDSCKRKGIDGFPTWIFGGGNKVVGGLSLTDISRLSGCALPRESKGR